MGRISELGESITDPDRYLHEAVVDWAEGSIMLIDGSCWDACGGWDETFFLYSEETEYALRARDLGFSMIYTPAAGARHLEGDAATNPPLWALMTLNRGESGDNAIGPQLFDGLGLIRTEELRIADEELAHFRAEADDARLRAMVSDRPEAAREDKEAQRSVDAITRQRQHLAGQIERLERAQDELLDELGAARRTAGGRP